MEMTKEEYMKLPHKYDAILLMNVGDRKRLTDIKDGKGAVLEVVKVEEDENEIPKITIQVKKCSII